MTREGFPCRESKYLSWEGGGKEPGRGEQWGAGEARSKESGSRGKRQAGIPRLRTAQRPRAGRRKRSARPGPGLQPVLGSQEKAGPSPRRWERCRQGSWRERLPPARQDSFALSVTERTSPDHRSGRAVGGDVGRLSSACVHQRARTRKFLQPLGKGERVVWCPAPRGGGGGGGRYRWRENFRKGGYVWFGFLSI